MLSSSITHYNEHGWVLETGAISASVISEIRSRGLELRNWVSDKAGTPSSYGTDIHWPGVSCASMYSGSTLLNGYVLDDYLQRFYQSNIMYNNASELLGTGSIWLFNDQIVVKLPGDNFGFEPHYDNQYGAENSDGSMHTVNMCVILDDFTDANGKIAVKHSDDQWVELYPSAGDILALNGNTYHQSDINTSDAPRGLYACVYSEAQINLHNFYRERFLTTYSL